jgi:uncharacterized protein (TIGR00304 family)
MIEIPAFIMMAIGIYLIFRGLIEQPEIEYRKEIPQQEMSRDERWEERKEKREVKGGGVILIGPIPIVFGESRYAVYALILAIVLMALSILFLAGLRWI